MVNLGEQKIIRTEGSADKVVSTFLLVYLASKKLADKELKVATALVCRYSEYVFNGVAEPYASIILFSTATRKEIGAELNISSAHLNNTFDSLTKKDILVKEDGKYLMNPLLLPTKKLIFEFEVTK